MKKLIITLIYLLFALNTFPIYFKHIGMKDGLSQLSVMSIYQDELGRMWFGTLEGISMYDGENTVSFKPSGFNNRTPPENGLKGNYNRFITGNKSGNIYFLSDNSFMVYNNRMQQFNCLRESGVTTVSAYKETIWIGINDSVCTWNPVQEQPVLVCQLANKHQRALKIQIGSDNKCWIGTGAGLYMKDHNQPLTCIIPSEDICDIFEDSGNNLWIATRTNGVYKREPNGTIIRYQHNVTDPNSLSDNQVRSFAEDNFGNIWIGTFNGLNKYNVRTNQFTLYTKDTLPGSLTHTSVFAVYKDNQGSIWVGTYYGGVHYFNPETDIFTFYSENITRNDCLSFPYVGHMAEDKDNNIWICTEGGGLNFFDRKTKKFTHFLAGNTSQSVPHNNLKGICYSAKYNKLYIGTYTGGLSIYDISTKKFRNLYTENPSYAEIAGNIVNQVNLYKDQYLMLLTRKGILKMDLKTEKITPLFEKGNSYTGFNFTIDSKEYIWISTGWYVLKINLKDETDQKKFYYGKDGLGHFSVTKIIEDRKGRIFLGTQGSGIYCYNEHANNFTGYTAEKDLLQSNYCYNIAESVQGYLVISGDKGLTFLNPDRKIVKAVDLETALPISGINNGCGLLVCRNGEIFTGGIDGVASFFEQELFSAAKEYRLYFSGLYINNEIVYPNDQNKVLTEAFPYTKKIELTHRQNNLIFSFTSNNYINTLKKTAYEYKLEGFDTKWIQGNSKNIAYTNLNPGSYVLTVREKQYDPNVQPQSIKMEVVIHSPFYATPLFYFLYLIIIIGIIYSIIRFKQSQLLLQTSLEFERKEKEQIEELNQAKLQFFSNISHEFRTPLTLIISQLELLLQSSSLAPYLYNKLLKVYKNTYQMRNLIGELLDFRKLEQGHVTLKVCEQNIIPFLKEIYLSFYEYAASRSITYQFSAPNEEVLCWYDGKQMQKVFYNLLSNAFNYSKANGSIDVVVEDNGHEIIIKVIDTGIGINKESLNKIFDCFYQADNNLSGASKAPGTGIGLSLTKSIVELHHGNIQVESTPGYGSIFIVRLQKGRTHFSDSECVFSEPENNLLQLNSMPDIPVLDQEKSSETPLIENEVTHTVLIVEDNEELLVILHSLFAPIYRVVLARNGKEGLTKAAQEKPDIIVSDVMMPEMSGIEMCLKIKNDFNLCHIPVILLTALTSAEQSIEGLQRGADDYISKPFNAKVLIARCNNLIRNRIILQKKFKNQENFNTQSLASNPIDQKFLDSVNAIIEKNLNNTDFDMNILARELALSRSSLYSKFKALTGITPNDFVLNCKLKRAALMLKNNPDLQITEISDQLGFGSARYFSRCFKAQFEVTPMEYRKKEE